MTFSKKILRAGLILALLCSCFLYLIAFGFASHRYEREATKANIEIALLIRDGHENPAHRSEVVRSMTFLKDISTPFEPKFLQPSSIWRSLTERETHPPIQTMGSRYVVYWKADMAGVQLPPVDLSLAELNEANFRHAEMMSPDLHGANLDNADFYSAAIVDGTLTGALLRNANLEGAVLKNTVLRQARLDGSNFQGANLADVELIGANLQGVNLEGTMNLTIDQLKEACVYQSTFLPLDQWDSAKDMDDYSKLFIIEDPQWFDQQLNSVMN